MTQKLNWTTNDVANTDTLSYRIEQLGNSVSVIYQFKDGQAMRYNDLDSVEAAKQWAQNYHNKYGASHE